jgi:mRNA-degrading endonuclease RelE of RelBE toxin-antitoxin system
MARYRVVIRKDAEAEFLAIPFPHRRQLNQLIFKLMDTPRLAGSTLIDEGTYRIEAHGWVLTYEVDDDRQMLVIARFRKASTPTG